MKINRFLPILMGILVVLVNHPSRIQMMEYILKINETDSIDGITEYLFDNNISILTSIPESNIYTVLIPINQITDIFFDYAKKITAIKYFEPNYYQKVEYIPDDPKRGDQWSLNKIDMESAWEVNKGSFDITVAILDSGVDYTHPDLVNNYLPLGYDWVNLDNDPMDDNGHGTSVLGIIAANINNGLGIAGIANVSFFAEKFLDSLSPYGNKEVRQNMAEILQIPPVGENGTFRPDQIILLLKYHAEMSLVLQIGIETGIYQPGLYELIRDPAAWRFRRWERRDS